MDVYVVFHVEFEVLLQKTELICIFEESVTLSKQIVTSGTQASNGTEELAFSFPKSSQRWLHNTRTVLCDLATSINSVV